MNDPNGLVSVERPHATPSTSTTPTRRTGTRCTGATRFRDDLVDWTHLPVFLHPRPVMLADRPGRAAPIQARPFPRAEGGLRVFYTDREDGRLPEQEWQMTAVSPRLPRRRPVRRGDRPSARRSTASATTCATPTSSWGPTGRWKMVLGGNDAGAALVLLYETADPEAAAGWRFVGRAAPRAPAARVPGRVPLPRPARWRGRGAVCAGLRADRPSPPDQGQAQPEPRPRRPLRRPALRGDRAAGARLRRRLLRLPGLRPGTDGRWAWPGPPTGPTSAAARISRAR